MRAKKVSKEALPLMTTLDLAGAPTAECNVMMDDGPCALLVRRVQPDMVEDNTSDFGIDFPLSVGSTPRNDIFCPDVVGINDDVADSIERR